MSCSTAIPSAAIKISFKFGLTKRLLFMLPVLLIRDNPHFPVRRRTPVHLSPKLSARIHITLRENYVHGSSQSSIRLEQTVPSRFWLRLTLLPPTLDGHKQCRCGSSA